MKFIVFTLIEYLILFVFSEETKSQEGTPSLNSETNHSNKVISENDKKRYVHFRINKLLA